MAKRILSIIKKVVRENLDLNEVRTAITPETREKSLISGQSRRNRVGDEFAAYNPPDEKSPGLKPRNIKPDEARKVNKKVQFKESLDESYDFNIVKPSGYGTFLTAKEIGIQFQSAFEHHPSVVEEIKKRNRKKKYELDNKDV